MTQVDGHLYIAPGLSFGGRLDDGVLRVGIDPRVSLLAAFSLLLWWQGRLDQSAAHSAQAVGLAPELGEARELLASA